MFLGYVDIAKVNEELAKGNPAFWLTTLSRL
ncbi:hypothetical protein KVMX100_121180 [Klebsiella variicola]|nr:hypothetical protein KVMX100_121180 [Klebsiella variicola]